MNQGISIKSSKGTCGDAGFSSASIPDPKRIWMTLTRGKDLTVKELSDCSE